MAALREILARFGISAETKQLDKADRRVSSTTRSLNGLVAAAGGAATIMAMRRFVGDSIAMGDELDKTAIQVGLATSELQGLRHAANLGGVGATEFSNSLGQLQRRADDAANGGAQTSEAFSRLGVDIKDVNGELLPANELFLRVAEGLHNLDNNSEKTALSMELMGRQGRRMLPMFADGRAGVEAMANELAELGGGASAEFIEQAVALTDDITRANLAVSSFRTTLLTALLPTMSRVVTWMTRVAASMAETGAAAKAAKPIMVALGAAAVAAGIKVGIAWGAAIWPVLLVAAGFAVLYLAIDDVTTALEGGDSVLEHFINSLGFLIDMPALGTQSLKGFRNAWEMYFQLVESGVEPMDALAETLSRLWVVAEEGRGLGIAIASSVLSWVAAFQELTQAAMALNQALAELPLIGGLFEGNILGETNVSEGTGARNTGRSRSFLDSLPGANLGRRLFGSGEPDAASTEQSAAARRYYGSLDLAGAPARTQSGVAQPTGNYALATPTQTSNVEIGDSLTTINVTEAQNPHATALVVRQEIFRQETARNRAILAAVEPARES